MIMATKRALLSVALMCTVVAGFDGSIKLFKPRTALRRAGDGGGNSGELKLPLPQQQQQQQLDALPGSVLVLSPMRDAAGHMDRFFVNLQLLAYPPPLLSFGALVGDSRDDTVPRCKRYAARLLGAWRRHTVVHHDFNSTTALAFKQRHQVTYQRERRALLARARNLLLRHALRDEQWVLWLDSDVAEYPETLVSDLVGYNSDILAANAMFRDDDGVLRPYDLNSWSETPQSRRIQRVLEPDFLLLEGYDEIKTYRLRLGDLYGGPEQVVPLDGVGSAALLVRGGLFRRGLRFPEAPFQHSIESEGLAKAAAAKLGVRAYGLPNYVVVHA